MEDLQGAASVLKVGSSGEVITNSFIPNGYLSRSIDPRKKDVCENMESPVLETYIQQSSKAPKLEASPNNDSAEELAATILEYLNGRSLQFNSRALFRQHVPWQDAVRSQILEQKPISVIIPIFCNIGNPLKRFFETTVTAGEKVTLQYLANISREIASIYPPALQFVVVVDANFYSTPFMNAVVETNAYLDGLKEYVTISGLARYIDVVDMTSLLMHRSSQFTERFEFQMHRLITSDNDEGIDISTWVSSMVGCLNLRYLKYDYGMLHDTYYNDESSTRKEIVAQAKRSLQIYRSLKNAAADLYWESMIDRNAVRATIHTKNIPVLGLRVYPEYKKSSNLLPYHGIALFERKGADRRIRMRVVAEAEVVALSGVVRLRNAQGVTQAYSTTED